MTVADLQSFAIPGAASIVEGNGGLPAIDIATALATARIYLHGGHVAAWTPAGAAPVLFMSESSHFAAGKPIRGGVPICFPWFGGRAGRPDSPAHGFVRSLSWGLETLVAEPDGTICAVLEISENDTTRAHWPHTFTLRHRIRVGATLEMTLEFVNRGTDTVTFEEALHTYLAVGDAREVEVTGLESTCYIDKVHGGVRRVHPAEPLRFTEETDRVFSGTSATCVLRDPVLKREIVVEKSGSATTVVWNPWVAKAKAMADFGDEEWPGMVCIETANTAEDSVKVEAGASHEMTSRIRLAPLS